MIYYLQFFNIIFLIFNHNIPSIQQVSDRKPFTSINFQHLLQQCNELITEIIFPYNLIKIILVYISYTTFYYTTIIDVTILYIMFGTVDIAQSLLRKQSGHLEYILHLSLIHIQMCIRDSIKNRRKKEMDLKRELLSYRKVQDSGL